jgi:hypothetical protein
MAGIDATAKKSPPRAGQGDITARGKKESPETPAILPPIAGGRPITFSSV